jgi:TolA-binding protein
VTEASDSSTITIAVASVIGLLTSIITGILSYFGGRGSVAAQIQTALNNSFESLSERLEIDNVSLRRRVTELEGNQRKMEQHISSLESLLRRNGIEVPSPPRIDTIVHLGDTAPRLDN